MEKIVLSLAAFIISCFQGCSGTATGEADPDYNTFCFYYNWYGTEEIDGRNSHWAHDVLGVAEPGFIPGTGGDIACNFYPEGGIYSSKDPAVVRRHMQQMAGARIGVVVLTWWKENYIGNESIDLIMDEADLAGLKVCFHIEPYACRTARSVVEDVEGLNNKYGSHPAFYRINGRSVNFIYDSYLIPDSEWAEVLPEDAPHSIRGTGADGIYVALLVSTDKKEEIRDAGFDALYTYFAADGFTEGSTTANWPELNEWSNANGLTFIPCAGPGYVDTRVRPWNTSTTRDRENGKYYRKMFNSAIGCGAEFIGVTSFNEWHEGTQIEPSVPFSCDSFTYEDYSPQQPDFYLSLTSELIGGFIDRRNRYQCR